jgi:recombination protein RecA
MAKQSDAALNKFLASFEKDYGEGAITTAQLPTYKVIPTGSLALDQAIGCGGYPLGRVVQLKGPPSGGKSSLTLLGAAEAQKAYPGRMVAFVDVEQTFDGAWAETLGVDRDRLFVVNPKTAEDVADIMKDLTMSSQFSFVILDSVGAMIPDVEFTKDADEATVGTTAKIITRMVKICTYYARVNSVTLAIINQQRAAIGAYGADITTGGGFALKHAITLDLDIKRGSKAYTVGTEESKVNVGYDMLVRVQKNKVAPEGRVAKIGFVTEQSDKYGPVGVDRVKETISIGIVSNAIKQTGGGFYTFPDGTRVRGRDAVEETIRERPSLVDEVRECILAGLASGLKHDGPVPDLSQIDA